MQSGVLSVFIIHILIYNLYLYHNDNANFQVSVFKVLIQKGCYRGLKDNCKPG